MRGSEVIVRLRGAQRDRFGDAVPDTASSKAFRQCIVLPNGSIETTFTQDTTTTRKEVYIPPPNADIVAEDQILYDSRVWNVVGDPATYNKRGVDKGTFVIMEIGRG